MHVVTHGAVYRAVGILANPIRSQGANAVRYKAVPRSMQSHIFRAMSMCRGEQLAVFEGCGIGDTSLFHFVVRPPLAGHLQAVVDTDTAEGMKTRRSKPMYFSKNWETMHADC